ncbi:MAG: dTDP-4-dehydrorhamnose 3,5-epimerase [Pseudomonadota bacterium]
MKFQKTSLSGACVIDLETHDDNRGFFARVWCAHEFEDAGLKNGTAQINMSYNSKAGTLRGMHYQIAPHEEVKVVRCVRGALYDVIIDLRVDSPSFGQHFGIELSAKNRRALYVPEGFAHGFQTLEDDTEALYQVTEFYAPGSERGLRFNDSRFDIRWPLPVSTISDKDRDWPDFA